MASTRRGRRRGRGLLLFEMVGSRKPVSQPLPPLRLLEPLLGGLERLTYPSVGVGCRLCGRLALLFCRLRLALPCLLIALSSACSTIRRLLALSEAWDVTLDVRLWLLLRLLKRDTGGLRTVLDVVVVALPKPAASSTDATSGTVERRSGVRMMERGICWY